MKKIIFALALSAIYAFAGCGGCRDEGLGQQLGEQSKMLFNQLDEETSQKIDEIVKLINKAHQNLEVQNRDILIQNQKLAALQALIQREITYNQSVIARLQDVVNSKDAARGFKQ